MKNYFLPSPQGMILISIDKKESIFRGINPKNSVISVPVSNEDMIPMVGSIMGEKEEKLLKDFIAS
jgi:hypothetical protein